MLGTVFVRMRRQILKALWGRARSLSKPKPKQRFRRFGDNESRDGKILRFHLARFSDAITTPPASFSRTAILPYTVGFEGLFSRHDCLGLKVRFLDSATPPGVLPRVLGQKRTLPEITSLDLLLSYPSSSLPASVNRFVSVPPAPTRTAPKPSRSRTESIPCHTRFGIDGLQDAFSVSLCCPRLVAIRASSREPRTARASIGLSNSGDKTRRCPRKWTNTAAH
jgi:hypothetical protein